MSDTIQRGKLHVYRMSLPGNRSMWYDSDGQFSPICEEAEAIPMPIDRVRLDLAMAGDWVSSTDNLDLMPVWFPEPFMNKLVDLGMVLHRYEATEWVELPNEIVFRRDTALAMTRWKNINKTP